MGIIVILPVQRKNMQYARLAQVFPGVPDWPSPAGRALGLRPEPPVGRRLGLRLPSLTGTSPRTRRRGGRGASPLLSPKAASTQLPPPPLRCGFVQPGPCEGAFPLPSPPLTRPRKQAPPRALLRSEREESDERDHHQPGRDGEPGRHLPAGYGQHRSRDRGRGGRVADARA